MENKKKGVVMKIKAQTIILNKVMKRAHERQYG